jgi:hypothetical protein
MIRTRNNFFKYFEARIRCAINRIQYRGLAFSYTEYHVVETNRHYTISSKGYANPLSLIIENRYKQPTYSSPIDATAKILNCDTDIIRSFRDGFSGRTLGTSVKSSTYKEYYILGATLRRELKTKPLSKLSLNDYF